MIEKEKIEALIRRLKEGYESEMKSCGSISSAMILSGKMAALDELWGLVESTQEEPKFKVGDTIRKEGFNNGFVISKIDGGFYYNAAGDYFPVNGQDQWELVKEPVNKLWRHISKKPRYGKWLFVTDKKHKHVSFIHTGKVSWNDMARWAYVSDLLSSVYSRDFEKYFLEISGDLLDRIIDAVQQMDGEVQDSGFYPPEWSGVRENFIKELKKRLGYEEV